MYQVESPVLFLVFNRPNESRSVFEAIRKVKPKKFYIAGDGPRKGHLNDIENCAKTREIVNEIDWPCQVVLLMRNENLGCGLAVSQALNWFFDNEPEGIVLEDDCLPNDDFFRFCDSMLQKYRHDGRIGHISGTNMHDNIKRGNATYFFSRLTGIWGWASWARVWKDYDYHLSKLDSAIGANFLDDLIPNRRIQKSLLRDFINTKAGNNDTWDYQYLFMHLISHRMSVFPNSNLISNIGFNSNGTHTLSDSEYSAVKTKPLDDDITHPDIYLPSKSADIYTLEKAIPARPYAYFRKLKRILFK